MMIDLDTNVLVRYLMQGDRFRTGSADFADCLIEQIGRSKGCGATMTLDKLASKSAGMTLLG